MDLLIYNKEHWYDTTTQKRRDEVDAQYPGKFAKRYVKGDIVEVAETGRYANQANDSFAVVSLPGEKKDFDYLMKAQEDLKDPENPVLVKRRQYNVDTTKVALVEAKATVAKIDDAEITDKETDTKVIEK